MTSIQFDVHPQKGLVDDPVLLKVTGLKANQQVTLAALIQEGKITFTSYAYYKADSSGCLDLSKDPALGGSYTGVEPQGFLWSMAPAPGQQKGARLIKKDVTQPFLVRVSVLNGHLQANTAEHHSAKQVLGYTDLERSYMASWVKREDIREGALRGTLFYPKTEASQHPGVLDLYGSTGGLAEHRAALLASRGFSALALAYLYFEDRPTGFEEFSFEYFEEAVDWLSTHPAVCPGGVGAVGYSKGAEMAMFASIFSTKVKAVVSIAGYCVNSLFPLTYRGQHLPAFEVRNEHLEKIGEEMKFPSWPEETQVAECAIPIERASHSQFLFIHGSDDQILCAKNSLTLVQRLQDAGLDNYELHIYPKAGHMLDVPYTPLTTQPWHRFYKAHILTGGERAPHAQAQLDMWPKVLTFLKKNLPPPEDVSGGQKESPTSYDVHRSPKPRMSKNSGRQMHNVLSYPHVMLNKLKYFARLIFH